MRKLTAFMAGAAMAALLFCSGCLGYEYKGPPKTEDGAVIPAPSYSTNTAAAVPAKASAPTKPPFRHTPKRGQPYYAEPQNK